MPFLLHARVAGQPVDLEMPGDDDPLLSALAQELAARTGLDPATIKLLGGGVKALALGAAAPDARCSSAGELLLVMQQQQAQPT